MLAIRNLTGAVLAIGLAAGALGAMSAAAQASPRHPPGPDRCWSLQHHHWVNVCTRRDRAESTFPTLYSAPAFTDPGYPNRSWSDPGRYDPSYYDRFTLFIF